MIISHWFGRLARFAVYVLPIAFAISTNMQAEIVTFAPYTYQYVYQRTPVFDVYTLSGGFSR